MKDKVTHEETLGPVRVAIVHSCDPRNLRTATDVTAAAHLIEAYRKLLDEECWANATVRE